MSKSETAVATPRGKKILTGVAIIGGVAALAILGVTFQANDAPPSEMKAAPGDRIQGGAGGEGSPEYNARLGQLSAEQAELAARTGESHIAPPIGRQAQPRPLLTPTREAPAQAPQQPAPVSPGLPKPARPAKTNDDLRKRMLEEMNSMEARLAALTSTQGAIVYQYDFAAAEKEPQRSEEASASQPETQPAAIPLQPGDMLYAVVDTAVNSDVPSAVMATVSTGKLRKTRFIGKFQRLDERLVLTFTRAVLPDGSSVGIEAYAVDPETTEVSVASSVDTHFLERWGGLIAASFLEGFGEAKRYSGAESTVYGNYNGTSDQMVWNDYSLEDQAWIAAGKVGQRAGRVFEQGFNRPPTVRLASGCPIGVLVLNTKQ